MEGLWRDKKKPETRQVENSLVRDVPVAGLVSPPERRAERIESPWSLAKHLK
jgi:hypothetical protein